MFVTSGVRSWEEHVEIYRKDLKNKFKIELVPRGSCHLIGAAVDFADPTGELYEWLLESELLLEECELYMELNTRGWVHLQIRSPKSGKRYFNA